MTHYKGAVATQERVTATVAADIRLDADAVPGHVRRAIQSDLTFPNPERRTLERLGRYAGHLPASIPAFEHVDGTLVLPRGYGPRLRELLGDTLHADDETAAQDAVDVRFRGNLRDYQDRALAAALGGRDAVVVSPPGSGKTVIALAWMAARRQPTLLVVNTHDLADQAADRAREFLGVEAGRIGGGVWEIGNELTVATVQTLARNLDKLADLPFGAVIFDEAHHVPADTFFAVASRLPARFRLGITATPDRADGLEGLLPAALGPIAHTITQADLEAAGVNVRPSLVWVETGFTYPGDPTEFTRLVTALTEDERRNALALRLIKREAVGGGVVLALTDRVAHAQMLADELRARGVTAEALVGSVKADERQRILADFRAGAVSIVVATRLADEGLDVPELDRLFLLAPMRASGRVTQRLGRLMRARPGKEPIVFDFRDVKVGLLESQARSRWFNVYRNIVADEKRIGGAAGCIA